MQKVKIVYAMQRENGDIKIGKTYNIAQRLMRLKAENGPLSVVGWMYGYTEEEKAAHKELAEHNVGGEFFTPSEEVMTFIREKMFPPPLPEHRPPATVAVRKTTGQSLRDFADGAGIVYDDAINFLLDAYCGDSKTWTVGRDNRDAIQAHIEERKS